MDDVDGGQEAMKDGVAVVMKMSTACSMPAMTRRCERKIEKHGACQQQRTVMSKGKTDNARKPIV